MKRARITLGILCLVTLIGFGVYLFMGYKNRDLEPPVLKAKSAVLTVSINSDQSELLKDVTATDNKDGDISDRILIQNTVKKENGKQNEFQVTYVVFDQANNAGQLTRDLIYTDYRLPHFSLDQPLRFPENQEWSLLNYFKADDCLEGDISTFITMEDHTGVLKQSPRAGFYEVTLSVTNSFGDTASLPVQIEIYQNSYDEQMYRPRIMLKEYIVYVEKDSSFDAKSYLDYVVDRGTYLIDYTNSTFNTNLQKINASAIQAESDVDTKVPGVYSVIYTYTSSKTGYKGNTRLVVVVE